MGQAHSRARKPSGLFLSYPLLHVGELDPRAKLRLSSEIPEDSLLSPLSEEPENGLFWLG